MFTGFTEEIDDVGAAVSEVMGRLALGGRLMKSTIGILHCFSDFVDSGVVAALCEKLPFDVVGCTTINVCAPGVISSMGLVVSVLTSDDAVFSAGASEPVNSGDLNAALSELYGRVCGSVGTSDPGRVGESESGPQLLMPFIPFMASASGDDFIAALDALSGGIPAFGTLPISDETNFKSCYTIFNGECYADSLVLAAVSGNVEPAFLSASILESPETDVLTPTSIITEASKNVLVSLNGIPAEDLIVSTGLAQKGGLGNLISLPFVIDLADGTRLIRYCIGSDGNGGAILCGNAPVGASVGFTNMGIDEIVKSTGKKVMEAMATAGGRGLLMYSCAARLWALGASNQAETEEISKVIGGRAPYFCACSGGEIFPQRLTDGKVTNTLQNASMIICML
jgi:hypothetical protein